MSYDAKESGTEGAPFELYQFSTADYTWRYTSAPEDIIFKGARFTAEIISRTNTTASAEVKGGHITVNLPKDNPIAALFISFIPSTPLALVIYRGHYGESESETKVAFTGRTLLARFSTDDKCQLECAPDTEVLRRQIGTALFQRQCNHVLFDRGCSVDNAFWKIPGLVAAIAPDGITLTINACAGKSNGWFNWGFIEKGYARRMILTHTGSQIVLINPMQGLVVGDTVLVYAGCDRTYNGPQGCVQKFNNGVNFMGWEWIPKKNPFSGGLEN
jgi:uncharacterized phage protein (TIGR02218 family)